MEIPEGLKMQGKGFCGFLDTIAKRDFASVGGINYSGNLQGVSITGDISNCSQSRCDFGECFSHQNRH